MCLLYTSSVCLSSMKSSLFEDILHFNQGFLWNSSFKKRDSSSLISREKHRPSQHLNTVILTLNTSSSLFLVFHRERETCIASCTFVP